MPLVSRILIGCLGLHLGDFTGVGGHSPHALGVCGHHDVSRLFFRLREKSSQNFDHKSPGRKRIIVNEDNKHRWPLGFFLGLLCDVDAFLGFHMLGV